jgi:copper(I)-binding protein
MIHAQQMDGGIMRMRMLERLGIPAGTTVAMHAGGLHVMLEALSHSPQPGGLFPMTLRFERARELTVQVKVLPLGSAP